MSGKTNKMQDKTAKDNRETVQWINHDLTRNKKLAFSSMRIFNFTVFNTEIFLSLFQLRCHQRRDVDDILQIKGSLSSSRMNSPIPSLLLPLWQNDSLCELLV